MAVAGGGDPRREADAGREPVGVGRRREVLDVVVDDAVLAQARADGGCRRRRRGRAGTAAGRRRRAAPRATRSSRRSSESNARTIAWARCERACACSWSSFMQVAQAARELRAERRGHAAGDLVVVDDEKDAERVGGPGGRHGDRILFAAVALGPARRPANVTNARHAARRRSGIGLNDPLLHFCDGHVLLRSPPGRPTGEPGPGVAARRRRDADRAPGAGASRARGASCGDAARPHLPDPTRAAAAARETWRPRLAARACDDRTRIQEPGAARLQPHSADRRGVRRPRDAALALPQARAARQARPAAATASCSNRWSAASASAAIRSSACRRARCCARPAFAPRSSPTARSSRPTRATRSISSPPTSSASASRCGPGCRASAAASPATSATTRCASSSRAWPRRPRRGRCPTRSARPTCCSSSARKLAVIDNLSGRLYLIVYADPGVPEAFATARRRLLELTDRLRASVTAPPVERGAAEPVRRDFDEGRLPRRRRARQGVHRRRRPDAGAGRPAHEQALHRLAAQPLPRAALAQPVAVHVLLRHGRFPDRRRLARDPGPARGRAPKATR